MCGSCPSHSVADARDVRAALGESRRDEVRRGGFFVPASRHSRPTRIFSRYAGLIGCFLLTCECQRRNSGNGMCAPDSTIRSAHARKEGRSIDRSLVQATHSRPSIVRRCRSVLNGRMAAARFRHPTPGSTRRWDLERRGASRRIRRSVATVLPRGCVGIPRRHRSGRRPDQRTSAGAAMPAHADKLGTGCWNGRSVIARSLTQRP
jgi:hypothetical protein